MHNLGWQICDAFRYFASSSQSRSPVCAALPASLDLSWVALLALFNSVAPVAPFALLALVALVATVASFTMLALFTSVAFGPRPVSHHGFPLGASVAFGSTSIIVHGSWFPLGASVIVSSASLGVQVGQGPFDLVVTISLRRGIVGHCFTLAHDLQEPSVYELILLASAVIAEFVNFAAQIIVILFQWRSCACIR